MTNAPESRKTHICRIVGTNRDGERLDDIWVDLERMDLIKGSMQIPPDFQWQGFQRKIVWSDNPDDPDYSPTGTPSRMTEIVKVCDPESTDDVNDPDEWVPVPVIKGMKSKGGGSESMGQGFMDRFTNNVDDGEAIARISVPRKISHYDTNIDDDAQAAFDADPERREYVVDGAAYDKDLSTKDDSQHVDHEIITFYKPKTDSLKAMGIGRQTKLLNEYLIDESDTPDGSVIGTSGINPPYRLDPFQNIVNVQLNPPKAVMAGLSDGVDQFGSTSSNDGLAWSHDTDLPENATNAASGFGFTVVASDDGFVAFGKPNDGDKCFILARRNGQIERGTLQQGEITWEAAGFIPVTNDGIDVFSCHFAGGAFFVGYSDLQGDKFLFAVSTSGTAFTLGVNPFPGVTQAANGTGVDNGRAEPTAGGVAYNPATGLYVTTGSFQRTYLVTYEVPANPDEPAVVHEVDRNFMSSVSSDGFGWTPSFDQSEASLGSGLNGPAGARGSTSSTVAFGNGVFVSIGARKGRILFDAGFAEYLYRGTAAALVSSDGSGWSVSALPNQPGISAETESTGSAVEFVKHRGLGPGIDGFFVMSSVVLTGNPGPQTGAVFYSLNGSGWSQVLSLSGNVPFVMSTPNKNKGKILNI